MARDQQEVVVTPEYTGPVEVTQREIDEWFTRVFGRSPNTEEDR